MRVSGAGDVALLERQRLAARHPNLPFDEIEPGDRLGDRVFDLQARVDLEEVELAVAVEEELHRPRTGVADGLPGGDSRRAHARPQRVVDGDRRRLFDDLLIAALNGALALEQMEHAAVRIAEDLQLDVARRVEVALDQQGVVAERARRLAPRRRQRLRQGARLAYQTHALAAAAGRGLDQQRQADALRFARQGRVVEPRTRLAGHHRHAGLGHDRARFHLAAHASDRIHRRADEGEAGVNAARRELGVLGQEAVAGMDRVGADCLRGRENTIDVEVRLQARRRTDAHRLVRLGGVRGAGIGIRVDGNRGHSHAPHGAKDPPGDLTAVGDQDLVDGARAHPRPVVRCSFSVVR